MKINKIAIFGSTGSIGKSLLSIIKKNTNFKITLLTCNRNLNLLLKQAKKFKVKQLIITDNKKFNLAKNDKRFRKFNIYNNFDKLEIIFKDKIDYAMNAIVGFNGLKPTLEIIKYTNYLAIANKESIICGWNLILKKSKLFNVKIIPIDSEHYSIYSLIGGIYDNKNVDNIKEVYLTASGGPFYNTNKKNFYKITVNDATQHPNWKMGKKISVDSATMVNKVFEVIEAQRLFGIKINSIFIKIHPKSYIHSIISLKNGLIKICAHKPDMIIPIAASLEIFNQKYKFVEKIDYKILNNLEFKDPNIKKFSAISILKNYKNSCSLFDTAFVSCNDTLVSLFLEKKINFDQISKYLVKILKLKEIILLKSKVPKNYEEIVKINNYVRLKTMNLCIKLDR